MLTRAPRGAAAHLELRNAWPVLFLTFSSMNNTEMLVEARNTGDSLHPAPISDKGANVICPTNNIFPSLEAIAHEELDGRGSEFSWSSIGSEPSKNDAPASAPEPTYGTEAIEGDIPSHNTIAPTRSHSSEPSIPKHPLYFWDFISFKVGPGLFQLLGVTERSGLGRGHGLPAAKVSICGRLGQVFEHPLSAWTR